MTTQTPDSDAKTSNEKPPTTAFLDGWATQAYGRGLNYNPYNILTQAKSHKEWNEGWGTRYIRGEHNGDLSLDKECF